MEIKDIEIKNIEVLENIRQTKAEEVSELMESIKSIGLLQPIGVKKSKKGDCILIWGYRRLQAFKKLGRKSIPAVIYNPDEDMTEESFLIANTSENIHRKAINTIELGRIVHHLAKTMSISEIAVKLSLSKSAVNGALDSFKRVPEKHRKKVKLIQAGTYREHAGVIASTSASTIIRLRGLTNAQKEKMFDWALKEDANITEVRIMGNLVAGGMSFAEASKRVKEFKAKDVKLVVDAKKHDKIEETQNFVHWVRDVLNKEMKGLVI